jgi:hypothetical protein
MNERPSQQSQLKFLEPMGILASRALRRSQAKRKKVIPIKDRRVEGP